MKNFLTPLLLVVTVAITTNAHSSPALDKSYSIAERGAHHRVWQAVTWETNKTGEARAKTNSYVEVETGMHYQENGQWVESEAKIEITPAGATAAKGPHQVNFAANANTIGAIDFTTSDQKRLRSHVLGLSYFDTATGKSALIAEIKDSIGELLPPNQVIYPDAFTDIEADISYTYSKYGFEQDVILRHELASPAEYGMNPETTRLEVLTEFVEAPVPEISEKALGDPLAPNAKDESLGFGAITIGAGIAFSIGDEGSATNLNILGGQPGGQVPVGKKWTRMEGRDFLIESVNYNSMKPHLDALPRLEARLEQKSPIRAAQNKATMERQLPARREARIVSENIQMASISKEIPGFLIDYSAVTGGTNYTFKGDTTYLVSGIVNIYGTITLEGGTVIKYSPTGSVYISSMDGLFDCKTDAYRPAIFTARNDDSVGEIISGSTGVPALYEACFAFKGGTPSLSNVRFSYGGWICSFWSGSSGGEVRDAQYVNCSIPINSEGKAIRLRNILMTKSVAPLRGNGAYTVSAENVTIDDVSAYLSGPGAGTISFTNSIAIALTNMGAGTIITNNSLIATNPVSGLFQTVGAGSYYLTTNSIYRNVGTTNINADLLANLKKKTTYPPIVISSTYYTNNLSLVPQAQRDTDTPDLGYHYDPLDYAIGSVIFTNCTITVSPGTAIGTFSAGSGYGMTVGTGSDYISEGQPHLLNYIVNYNTVQEQSNTNWIKSSPISMYSNWLTPLPAADANFRFTAWSMLAGSGTHFSGYNGNMPAASFRDCQFFNGIINGYGPGLYFTNNLLHRISFTFAVDDVALIWRNNTFYGGSCVLEFFDPSALRLYYNNLFAETLITQSVNETNDYNAFYNVTNTLTPAGASNVVVTNLTFQTGSLGHFYLSTNNVKLLDTGSTNANLLTLYHYTTVTNQVKETNSIVDIGFHYVAVDEDGHPVDTDEDGIPDYLEDSNGNGTTDSGETDWLDADDLGLRVLITRPRNGSHIP